MKKVKTDKGNLINWLILGLLGLFIIIGRQMAKNIMYRVLGIGLMLAAAASIAGRRKDKSGKPDTVAALMGSVLVFIIGVWILFNPGSFDKLINVVIGAVLVVTGIQWLIRGWYANRDVFTMALSAVSIILGLVIASTNAATTWLVIAEGVGLIYAAINGAVAELREKN